MFDKNKCKKCGKKWDSPSSLALHLQYEHNPEEKATSRIQRFKQKVHISKKTFHV